MAYKSNLDSLLRTIDGNINTSMEACGEAGVKQIKKETPVDSGDLQKSNEYDHSNFDSVTFYNNTEYAAAVEQGTYKQSANPFMRRALINSLGIFRAIFAKNMKL